MPYIDRSAWGRFEPALAELRAMIDARCTPGELNYLLTQMALAYLAARGLNYAHANDVVGALESAKQEFYRRIVAPYEERKRAENGDVYP
jgi:hypothetical protein